MAGSVAKIGFGMQLASSTTSNGTYASLVDLIEIKPNGLKVGKSESTHHQSPNTAEESVPGLIDYNELEAQVSWSKTEYPAFTTMLRQVLFWKVTYPDTSTDIFPGYLTEIQPATPLKERMTTSIKIQPTGLSTFAAAS